MILAQLIEVKTGAGVLKFAPPSRKKEEAILRAASRLLFGVFDAERQRETEMQAFAEHSCIEAPSGLKLHSTFPHDQPSATEPLATFDEWGREMPCRPNGDCFVLDINRLSDGDWEEVKAALSRGFRRFRLLEGLAPRGGEAEDPGKVADSAGVPTAEAV